MRQAKPNGTDSSMDFRKFRSRNMVPTVGMMKKPGDNHLGAHGARGQKISFSNRKAGGKGQSAAPARSGKFCHCPNDPSPPDGTDPHPLLQSCSLSVYSFHVCSCGAPGQPLPLGPPESGSVYYYSTMYYSLSILATQRRRKCICEIYALVQTKN